ncbi:MAG TPA: dipeptidase [Chitinophagaceae bacterium]
MRFFLSVLLVLTFSFLHGQSARRIHDKAILIDGHNDVLSSKVLNGVDISHRLTEGHSDLVRWREGGLDVQFFSVFTGEKARNKEGFFKDATQEIDSLNALLLRNPMQMTLATTYKEVKRGVRQEKLVALIGVEGGHMIESDMQKLNELYEMGMRYLTLTWNNSTDWASSARDETERPDSLKQKGLTEFGKQVVRRMNELGVIVDLSHTGEQTFYDAIATTTKPVMLSHSSVWNICPVFRNVKDEQIKAVAKNGGVICINFYSGFISKDYDQKSDYLTGTVRKKFQDSLYALGTDSVNVRTQWREYLRNEMKSIRPSLAELVDHIDYIVKLVGDDYAGIGSDYDGVSSLPVGMEDVTTYPKITEELLRRGYSKKSIKKILGGNVMRVMKANFK